MTVKKSIYSVLSLFVGVLLFAACSPKDEDVLKSVKEKLAEHPKYEHVTASVKDGKTELNGHVETAEAKASGEEEIKKIKGVKLVDNNIRITPPATVENAQEAAESPEDPILKGAKKALKDYPSVTSEVKDGEITITGDVSKEEEKAVLERLHVLKARKINNNLNVIKNKDKKE